MNAMTLRQEVTALHIAFEQMREPAFVVDLLSDRIVSANYAACAAMAMPPAELIGKHWSTCAKLLGQVSSCTVDESFVVAIASGDIRSPASNASCDALTGLATRHVLTEWRRSPVFRPFEQGAVLFIDLDNFKHVNDVFGHRVGDHVLVCVAERLMASVRADDLVVRYGGDEFLVIAQATKRRSNTTLLSRRIRRAIRAPIHLQGQEIVITASIGTASWSTPDVYLDELVAAADRAMYRSKLGRRKKRW